MCRAFCIIKTVFNKALVLRSLSTCPPNCLINQTPPSSLLKAAAAACHGSTTVTHLIYCIKGRKRCIQRTLLPMHRLRVRWRVQSCCIICNAMNFTGYSNCPANAVQTNPLWLLTITGFASCHATPMSCAALLWTSYATCFVVFYHLMEPSSQLHYAGLSSLSTCDQLISILRILGQILQFRPSYQLFIAQMASV